MKSIVKIFCVLLILLSVSSLRGQNTTAKAQIVEICKKARGKYDNTKAFSFNTVYKLYSNYTTKSVTTQYNGAAAKRGNTYYAKINNTEFVKWSDLYLKIDNDLKLMQVDKTGEEATDIEIYDLTKMMANFKDFDLTSNSTSWICTLTAPKITFVPYSKVIIHINKADYTISKQILYLLQQTSYKDKKGKKVYSYPRVEVTFSNFQASVGPYEPKFSKGLYISTKGKKYVTANKYSTYQIVE